MHPQPLDHDAAAPGTPARGQDRWLTVVACRPVAIEGR